MLNLPKQVIGRAITNFPLGKGTKCPTICAAVSDVDPSYVRTTSFLYRIQGEADPYIASLASTFGALPTLWLSFIPIFVAIAD